MNVWEYYSYVCNVLVKYRDTNIKNHYLNDTKRIANLFYSVSVFHWEIYFHQKYIQMFSFRKQKFSHCQKPHMVASK
jgi:hypothetical protein